MPWGSNRPNGNAVNPKYRSKEHRDLRAAYAQQLEQTGQLVCAQRVCVLFHRRITPATKWHLGHDDTGTRYIGPVHAICNVKDGARRARARQRATRLRW